MTPPRRKFIITAKERTMRFEVPPERTRAMVDEITSAARENKVQVLVCIEDERAALLAQFTFRIDGSIFHLTANHAWIETARRPTRRR